MGMILADHVDGMIGSSPPGDLIHGRLLGLLQCEYHSDISTHSCQAATAIVEQIAPQGHSVAAGVLGYRWKLEFAQPRMSIVTILKNFKCEISEVRYW